MNRSNGSVTDFLNDRAQKVSADGGIRRDYYMITEGGLKETTSAVRFSPAVSALLMQTA